MIGGHARVIICHGRRVVVLGGDGAHRGVPAGLEHGEGALVADHALLPPLCRRAWLRGRDELVPGLRPDSGQGEAVPCRPMAPLALTVPQPKHDPMTCMHGRLQGEPALLQSLTNWRTGLKARHCAHQPGAALPLQERGHRRRRRLRRRNARGRAPLAECGSVGHGLFGLNARRATKTACVQHSTSDETT